MKKCAKCDFEYDDAYDGCPQCAQRVTQPIAKLKQGNPAALVVLLAVVAALVVCGVLAGLGGLGHDTYSLAQYNAVSNGMTADEVFAAMGGPGTETVNQSIAGHTGQIYTWKNSSGSNAIVQLQDGHVVQKAQYGLK